MKPFSEMGDAELAAALRSLRPEPSRAFAAELDQRAAAGFPRRSPRTARNPVARCLAWLRAGNRRRRLIPAGGVAAVAIAIATVVVVGSNSDRSSSSDTVAMRSAERPQTPVPEIAPGVGGGGGSAAAGESYAAAAEDALKFFDGSGVRGAGTAAASQPSNSNSAFSLDNRAVERASRITIGTEPGDFGEAASKVFETVHAYDGIVLNSATHNGSETEAEASFELLIPSGKVGDAMAAFSRIGEVVNRHETTADITAPTVGASERLQDSEARIESLLSQLSAATTESEREVVEAELAAERRHAAHLKSKLSDLHRRASLARVNVRIASGSGAVSRGGSGEDESWGLGIALDDAGHLLSVAAGVTIVALAVLAPLLLLLVLAWLAGRAWTRRARERALT